ncbi:hypothetical protein JJB98_27840 [Bradyrhizobium diazoefficiens]|nr:hypothetical protein [Bradyrhizobium diazoefficiens]QQO23474.1 hypothetical protein JJB98_27840 [Bradyrhizobium diazoefficiens]
MKLGQGRRPDRLAWLLPFDAADPEKERGGCSPDWASSGHSSHLETTTPPAESVATRTGDQMNRADGLAEFGWLVEVCLIKERESDRRFFAVGTPDAGGAEEAILRFPGIVREERRTAQRRLSDDEIASLKLKTDGVRPYILVPGRG